MTGGGAPRFYLPTREPEDWAVLLDLDGLKVGGWPRTIQAEVDWSLTGNGRIDDAAFVLQVDSDEKSQVWIGDAGAAYLAWSPSQGWALSWQCH